MLEGSSRCKQNIGTRIDWWDASLQQHSEIVSDENSSAAVLLHNINTNLESTCFVRFTFILIQQLTGNDTAIRGFTTYIDVSNLILITCTPMPSQVCIT